jgi:hypothetical protein
MSNAVGSDRAAIFGISEGGPMVSSSPPAGGEIVDDQAAHDAVEEEPGRLQAVEHGREILGERDL